jgi:dolichyl-phosphate beta-glucosyltransferase
MGLVPPAVETPPAADGQASRVRDSARWLVLSGYLLAAVVLTWRLWVSPAGRMQAGDPHDVDLLSWYMRYAATAISHGRLPALFTTALNAPTGVSVMWNVSLLLPGVLLTPVTLLAGPQVSLTVLLTLGFAGSAASLFWVLRRWGASTSAAALGGAVYGFSPAMVNSGIGHYHLVLAAAPPLIIDALLRIVTGRGSAIRNGAWLGLLAGAQVFISEEMLVDTAVAGLVLVLALAAGHPRAVAGRVRAVALGLAVSVAVALVICGHALWVQLTGPQREHSVLLGSWVTNPAFFVDPAGTMLLHTSAGAAAAVNFHLGPPEVLAYLGWPLIVVLVAAAIRFWREPRVRAAAVTFVVLALCSLGGGSQRYLPLWLLPWHWIQHVPGLAQVLPNRFSILADGAAAAAGAFALDLARSAAPPARGWPRRTIPVAVAALAVLPLIPLPYQATAVAPVPAGWRAAFDRLRLAPDARVLVVPIPNVGHTYAMRWQAETGEPGSLIGGFFLGPDRTGQAIFDPGPARSIGKYLDFLWAGNHRVTSSSAAQIRPALAFWRPAAVVAVSTRPALVRVLTELLGRPALHVGEVLAWRL